MPSGPTTPTTALCIPRVPEEDYVQAVKAIVSVDQDWIPTAPGTSLYIRPFIIATEPFLGVDVSQTFQFIIILSPSAPIMKAAWSGGHLD